MDSEDFKKDDGAFDQAGMFNPYLFSRDPKLEEASEALYKAVNFSGHPSLVKQHLKILMLNIVYAKKQRKLGTIRYSRRNEYWRDFNKLWPNPWGISAKLDDVVDAMVEAGLLSRKIGFVTNDLKRQTRIQPTKKFTKKYINPFNLLNIPLEFHETFPLVQVHLKETPSYDPSSVWHWRYEAKGRTAIPNQLRKMKDQLRSYNSFIAKQKITLEYRAETKEALSAINFSLKKRSYRVFSNREINQGGRIYGGWWQEIKSELRQFIFINGKSAVECDYKAQHAAMVYGYCLGKSVEEVHGQGFDPYKFHKYPRELGKAIFIRALNVKSRNHVRGSLIKKYEDDLTVDKGKDKDTARLCLPYVLNEFDAVMDAFEAHHAPILKPKRFLYPQTKDKKWWKLFQFYDSQICMYVLETLRKEKIPCLSLHDSFIVQEKDEKRLREVMKEAYFKADLIPDLSKCLPKIEKK
ncbi:MAG: hypothetical protein KA952_08055 [Sediminibacterium sp.]|nr:hypothetical protein [Sediminibacterium sp.]